MSFREEVLTQMSAKIQEKTGLTKPTVSELSHFERNKARIESEIKRKKHFCEKDWPECKSVFNQSLQQLKNKNFDESDSDDEINFNDEHHPGTSRMSKNMR